MGQISVIISRNPGSALSANQHTGDILNSARPKYDLKYYTDLAVQLEKAGAHIIAVKDMAGLLKPAAARVLFRALREATDLPIHFHTQVTSGIAAATVLAAVESGADVVDAAMDALSGNTSQPCLGSIVDLCRCQPDVRRYRQGDAVLQGGRR